MTELLQVLSECKNGKSPGTDGITYEFLKHLPQNWLLYLCSMFNKILEYESVPPAWGETILKMLHKKGPKEDPNNYRGIALINCILKLFNKILQKRLVTFCDTNRIILESQQNLDLTVAAQIIFLF